MREELKNLKEMNDSRELLESKPNPIMPLFIYLLMFIICIAFIWTYIGEIDEVVKANAIVRTNETIGTVRNEVADQVESIHFSEGQHIEEGDILFTLKQKSLKLQKNLLNDDLEKMETRLADLEILRKSVEEDNDFFGEENRIENDVHERYISYRSNISLLEQELQGSTLEINQSIKEQTKQQVNIETQIANAKTRIEQLKRLKGAIQNQQNVFGKGENPYYQRYSSFELTLNQMEKIVRERKEGYEKLKDEMEAQKNEDVPEKVIEEMPINEEGKVETQTNAEEVITSEQVEDSSRLYEEAEYKLAQYKNDQLLQVDNEIQQEKIQLENVTISLQSGLDYSDMVDNQKDNFQASLENFKADTLVQVKNDIESLEQQKNQLKKELSSLEQQMEESVIKAPIKGMVNVRTKVSKGEFLPAGTEVLNIVPESNLPTFKVELTVQNHDIASTKVGDKVNLQIHSLPYQEYGQLYGKITKISTDAMIDPETGMSFYKAEAEINKEKLYSYKGEEATIKVGMTADAHIVGESKKVLYFLLEKIDLRD